LITAACLVCFLDQWSKYMLERWLGRGCVSLSYLRIRLVISQKRTTRKPASLTVLATTWLFALASILFLLYKGGMFQNQAGLLGIGASLGGAMANLLDTWRRGSIVDFIDLKRWPVFNGADVAIIGGAVLAFWPGN